MNASRSPSEAPPPRMARLARLPVFLALGGRPGFDRRPMHIHGRTPAAPPEAGFRRAPVLAWKSRPFEVGAT